MCEVDRQRHEDIGLAAGVAEHHPLVARAQAVEVVGVGAAPELQALVDAAGDVGRLLVDGDHDAAGVAVEAGARPVVADGLDRLPGDVGDVDVGVGPQLAGHHDQACGDERLAGHAGMLRVGVAHEDRIEDGVGHLVRDLVGVPLRDRLGGEQPATIHEHVPFGTSDGGESTGHPHPPGYEVSESMPRRAAPRHGRTGRRRAAPSW